MALIDQVWSTTAIVVGHCFGTQFGRKSHFLYAAGFSLGEFLTHPEVVQLCAVYMDFLPPKKRVVISKFSMAP